ncbi:uncharacterized protein MONBRDRAFT_28079 [Monosiga brevicollis MX1]|uniref:Helicase ATP-binding domain-containing protein n=1 Tax=Monosiga brevicollis TaxID=81824 RepID=A9V749_MONBE|nr:uncharacterized protein MONBRDRAFT_28079 [Monosiga brevicollis MX1]EDQ86658.1 predicted protein [Monosiga brevicollis MX1]|eukprot:XP_001748494.1 hypothetical protein [Monosiga brevicollis MX1]
MPPQPPTASASMPPQPPNRVQHATSLPPSYYAARAQKRHARSKRSDKSHSRKHVKIEPPTPAPVKSAERQQEEEGQEEEGHDLSEVFVPYRPQETGWGKPHPAQIVEPASLASVHLPKATYPLRKSLPASVIDDGKLSALQLEGVMYACMQHERILPNGYRRAILIGDGAGVGKGRQIAGILFENLLHERKRHIWFSISTDLCADAERDLRDIGCQVNVIDGCQELDKMTELPDGVLFSTYATLVSPGSRFSAESRYEQLVQWCGPEFDGCIVFDECHKAKNLHLEKPGASSKVALRVNDLQQAFPKARVVYCSATGVTDLRNLAYMDRLGMWGPGQAFANFEDFKREMSQNGIAAAEMLAMELKAQGVYLSRTLSYESAEFNNCDISLTEAQMDLYNRAADFWGRLYRAASRLGKVPRAYYAAHQRFFKQLCLSIKVPQLVARVKEALASGDHCVVIGLQSTGEARLQAAFARESGYRNSLVSLTEEIARAFIESTFPCPGRAFVPHAGPPTLGAQLLEELKNLRLPPSPLDDLIDQLGGPSAVAELTGRKQRQVRVGHTSSFVIEERAAINCGPIDPTDGINIVEKNAFLDGRKLIAIISDAASTGLMSLGISLHADVRRENQHRRVHFTFELPWSADKAVQQLGRSHRSNQACGPRYELMSTELAGERRFAAAVARRLRFMGALTRGDRRAASGQDMGSWDIDTNYGRLALREMGGLLQEKKKRESAYMAMTVSSILSLERILEHVPEGRLRARVCQLFPTDDALFQGLKANARRLHSSQAFKSVSAFLNGVLGLPVEGQNIMFGALMVLHRRTIERAKEEGKYSEGIHEITGDKIQLVSERDITSEVHHTELTRDRGMSFEEALDRLQAAPPGTARFMLQSRATGGQRRCVLVTEAPKRNPQHSTTYYFFRPNIGQVRHRFGAQELLSYNAVEPSAVKSTWQRIHSEAERLCLHGPKCTIPNCSFGKRRQRFHILSGRLVKYWKTLSDHLSRHSRYLIVAERSLNIARCSLGQRSFIGLLWPDALVQDLPSLFVPVAAPAPNPTSSLVERSLLGDRPQQHHKHPRLERTIRSAPAQPHVAQPRWTPSTASYTMPSQEASAGSHVPLFSRAAAGPPIKMQRSATTPAASRTTDFIDLTLDSDDDSGNDDGAKVSSIPTMRAHLPGPISTPGAAPSSHPESKPELKSAPDQASAVRTSTSSPEVIVLDDDDDNDDDDDADSKAVTAPSQPSRLAQPGPVSLLAVPAPMGGAHCVSQERSSAQQPATSTLPPQLPRHQSLDVKPVLLPEGIWTENQQLTNGPTPEASTPHELPMPPDTDSEAEASEWDEASDAESDVSSLPDVFVLSSRSTAPSPKRSKWSQPPA